VGRTATALGSRSRDCFLPIVGLGVLAIGDILIHGQMGRSGSYVTILRRWFYLPGGSGLAALVYVAGAVFALFATYRISRNEYKEHAYLLPAAVAVLAGVAVTVSSQVPYDSYARLDTNAWSVWTYAIPRFWPESSSSQPEASPLSAMTPLYGRPFWSSSSRSSYFVMYFGVLGMLGPDDHEVMLGHAGPGARVRRGLGTCLGKMDRDRRHGACRIPRPMPCGFWRPDAIRGVHPHDELGFHGLMPDSESAGAVGQMAPASARPRRCDGTRSIGVVTDP
jgi:hypothetical protein